jgi:hypothetical protein
MMQLEQPTLLATPAVLARIRAPCSVALDHRAANVVRDMPRAWFRFRPHRGSSHSSRPPPDREPLLQAIRDQVGVVQASGFVLRDRDR